MQYLILHKVRGEPAFDIAEKAMFGDEEGWVLCTCGHRAFPYQYWPVDQLGVSACPLPDDWPDHYPELIQKEVNVSAFLSSLSTFVRRI